ncbi:hypothetical protein [Vibrio hangzhouensis]|uniref:KfrA N-terminal DNA-binding domain-containing protein n=1 Tax=Vibrio hangzhouensis TaxID=462991 RepID=A0A1H6B394_9VIBR|nr:hypothetical protein [Vibrio hangzhouensis]MBY6198908.1 hypothetical protein [Vibrio hangzhouensis]SEG55323.1 hypothetical protein SAMN04488244_11931 [Vibrio hangzhouensis]
MLTKDVSAEIEAVLSALDAEGKEPSVALVKARLKSKVPMPALIAVIKSWRSSQHVPKVEVAADTQEPSLEQRVKQLELQVAELTRKLTALEQKHG